MKRLIGLLVFVLAMLYCQFVLGIHVVIAAILASVVTSLFEWRVFGEKLRF